MAERPRHRPSLAGRVHRLSRGRTDAVAAAAFLLPAALALLLFRLAPALLAVLTSFLDRRNGLTLDNYGFLFASPSFLRSMTTTIWFGLIINPVQLLSALALALLLTIKLPLAAVWRTAVFIPTAMPMAVAAIIWGVAYRPDGLINAVLAAVGQSPQPFLTSASQALPAIIVMLCWFGTGFWTVFLVAGLQDIPPEYSEAAAVDGAGWWRTLWHVTLPLLRRPLAFVLVGATVANFVIFDPVQLLTSGGPGESTNLIMFEVYRQAYTFSDVRLASAEVAVLMLVMLTVVVVQFRLLRSEA